MQRELNPIRSPIHLNPDLIEPASGVLARAFFDDPMTGYLVPNAARRAEILPAFFGAAVSHTCRLGGAYTTGALDAVALWVPPDAVGMTPDQAIVAADTFTAQMEAEESRRLSLLVQQLELLRQHYAPPSHWYLDVLGVDPPHQGRGIGGQIIQPVLLQADAGSMPCYLETFKERNLAFYQKLGFEALAEETILGGPRFWPMLRLPRAESPNKAVAL